MDKGRILEKQTWGLELGGCWAFPRQGWVARAESHRTKAGCVGEHQWIQPAWAIGFFSRNQRKPSTAEVLRPDIRVCGVAAQESTGWVSEQEGSSILG